MVLSVSAVVLTTTDFLIQSAASSVVVYQFLVAVTAAPFGQSHDTSSKLDYPLTTQYHPPFKSPTGAA